MINSLVNLSSKSNPWLETMSEKHQQSFGWIWTKGREGPGFVKWTRSNEPFYWITGLSRSGKSTLMKHLYEDHRLEELTIGKYQITVKVGYFFDKHGTAHEATFASLLASIAKKLLNSFGIRALACIDVFRELKWQGLWGEPDLRKVL